MDGAWGDWYHCTSHTFAAWLPGDRRGHRERHHRDHIDGDYRRPPKHPDEAKRRRAEDGMTRSRIILCPEARRHAVTFLVEALHYYQTELAELAVTATHLHVLARFPPDPEMVAKLLEQRQASPRFKTQSRSSPGDGWVGQVRNPLPRYYVGKAKSWCTTCFQKRGLAPCPPRGLGGLWAMRCGVEPVMGARHFERAVQYIRDHREKEGAVLARDVE